MEALSESLAIEARGLGKSYNLGQSFSIQIAARMWLLKVRGEWTPPSDLAAVNGVNFGIRVGECFGFLGANGSGKSTLVQLISGITVPSWGEVHVRGRVLPLMEVGAGFHLEMTGRENILLVGTMQGLRPREIQLAIPGIVRFAELERHLDTPLKYYSMGMQARLSFAIAMRFPADIYVFDEVMAVVDDHFRAIFKKDVLRLKSEGRTVILISHDLNVMRELCDRALWIDRGVVRMIGDIDEVADAYAEFQASPSAADGAGVPG